MIRSRAGSPNNLMNRSDPGDAFQRRLLSPGFGNAIFMDNVDDVAKTHQLLRCCACSRCFDVRKYASLLDNRAPCIWRFLLSHLLFCFLAKASMLT
jgi:hypothetical protein